MPEIREICAQGLCKTPEARISGAGKGIKDKSAPSARTLRAPGARHSAFRHKNTVSALPCRFRQRMFSEDTARHTGETALSARFLQEILEGCLVFWYFRWNMKNRAGCGLPFRMLRPAGFRHGSVAGTLVRLRALSAFSSGKCLSFWGELWNLITLDGCRFFHPSRPSCLRSSPRKWCLPCS